MGATKITDEELRKDLDAGLAVKEIAVKHGMSLSYLYKRIHRLRMATKSEETGSVSDLDCFAYDRFNGRCSCLEVEKCQRRSCPFYKEAGQALKEAMRGIGQSGVYQKNTLEVIIMIERNQGIRA